MTDPNQPNPQSSDPSRTPAPPSYPAAPSYPASQGRAGDDTVAGGADSDGTASDTNPPAYQPPAYASSPSYASGSAPVPGKTLGIVAFILSFFMQLIALVLGIVALVQSKKAGAKNGFALAAIIISSVLLVLAIIALVLVFALVLGPIMEACATYGPGEYTLENGMPLSCS